MTEVLLRKPYPKQRPLVESRKKRIIARAGRRSGKTSGAATRAVKDFLNGHRVLYAVPTDDQLTRFWFEVNRALRPLWEAGILYRNQTKHYYEFPNTETRIRAKNAWDEDTLRGDYADLLILDEWQMMRETCWDLVGAPMLLDNDGTAMFLYTPPSLGNRARSRSHDKLHAAKMYKAALLDPEWHALTFTSYDNPTITRAALERIGSGMTSLGRRMELLAEDVEEAPDALWKRSMFGKDRIRPIPPNLSRVVIGVDPSGTRGGDEVGICAVGVDRAGIVYILEDASVKGMSPNQWATEVVSAYYRHRADRVLGEANFGGDMVENTIRTIDPNISYKAVHASRGKVVRAEPVAAIYEQNRVFHARAMPELEDQLCMWTPDSNWSPDRMDAMVWGVSELGIKPAWSVVIE